MTTRKVTVKNSSGLHLRPVGVLCQTAMLYKSHIALKFEDTTSNAKSVLSVLGAGIRAGDEVEIVCEGADEQEALEAIANLLESQMV